MRCIRPSRASTARTLSARIGHRFRPGTTQVRFRGQDSSMALDGPRHLHLRGRRAARGVLAASEGDDGGCERVARGAPRHDLRHRSNNTIRRIDFTPRDAIVRRSGFVDQIGPFSSTPQTVSTSFQIIQRIPGAAATVHLAVTDGCGVFPTFAGRAGRLPMSSARARYGGHGVATPLLRTRLQGNGTRRRGAVDRLRCIERQVVNAPQRHGLVMLIGVRLMDQLQRLRKAEWWQREVDGAPAAG